MLIIFSFTSNLKIQVSIYSNLNPSPQLNSLPFRINPSKVFQLLCAHFTKQHTYNFLNIYKFRQNSWRKNYDSFSLNQPRDIYIYIYIRIADAIRAAYVLAFAFWFISHCVQFPLIQFNSATRHSIISVSDRFP